jgi:hypothetical protein
VKALVLIAVPLSLAACSYERPAPVEPIRECKADRVQTLVGRDAAPATIKQAQERATARTVRVIKPGMAVTMDYRTDRLNVELDGANKITALRCG